MPASFLTQEDGFRLQLEDGSGFLILESSSLTIFDFPEVDVKLVRKTNRTNVIRSIRSITLFRKSTKMNVLRRLINTKLFRQKNKTKF